MKDISGELERRLNLMGFADFTVPKQEASASFTNKEALFESLKNEAKVPRADAIVKLTFKHVPSIMAPGHSTPCRIGKAQCLFWRRSDGKIDRQRQTGQWQSKVSLSVRSRSCNPRPFHRSNCLRGNYSIRGNRKDSDKSDKEEFSRHSKTTDKKRAISEDEDDSQRKSARPASLVNQRRTNQMRASRKRSPLLKKKLSSLRT